MLEPRAARPSRALPRGLVELARALEPLWIASLALLLLVWGYDIVSAVGQTTGPVNTQTMQWRIYISMLLAFPAAAIVVALALPRIAKGQAATVVKTFAIVAGFTVGIMGLVNGRLVPAAAALAPAVATALMAPGAYRIVSDRPLERLIPLLVIGVVAFIAWMCAGGLVYWTGATSWFLATPYRGLAIVVASAVAITGLPRFGDSPELKAAPGVAFRIASAFLVVVLIAFSFRTMPIADFHRWDLWLGSIEQIREGRWLLRDAASPQGILSVFIPAALPGRAWVSFWYYQAVIYALVGVLMFIIFRRLRGGVGNLLLSFLAVFTTLFFRPRSASVLLPAQATPSGGPVNFFWCFVLLGWLLLVFREAKGRRQPGAGFPLVGHVIWICSIAWSFDAAVHASAIWLPTFAVYLIQRGSTERREGLSSSVIARRAIRSILLPVSLLMGLNLGVVAVYNATIGVTPDVQHYIQIASSYARGFGSLAIEANGAIWYLTLVFFIASTVVVQFLVDDWRDFRLAVATGVWGGVSSLASLFVLRGDPVDLLNITPALLFAIAVLMIVLRHSPRRMWHGYVRAATVPVFAMPIAMTLGHPQLAPDLRTKQLPPYKWTVSTLTYTVPLARRVPSRHFSAR